MLAFGIPAVKVNGKWVDLDFSTRGSPEKIEAVYITAFGESGAERAQAIDPALFTPDQIVARRISEVEVAAATAIKGTGLPRIAISRGLIASARIAAIAIAVHVAVFCAGTVVSHGLAWTYLVAKSVHVLFPDVRDITTPSNVERK